MTQRRRRRQAQVLEVRDVERVHVEREVPVQDLGPAWTPNLAARELQDLSAARQGWYKDHMPRPARGRCACCGREGWTWALSVPPIDPFSTGNLRRAFCLHHAEAELSLIMTSKPAPTPESEATSDRLTLRRDRSHDVDHDGRPVAGLELALYMLNEADRKADGLHRQKALLEGVRSEVRDEELSDKDRARGTWRILPRWLDDQVGGDYGRPLTREEIDRLNRRRGRSRPPAGAYMSAPAITGASP